MRHAPGVHVTEHHTAQGRVTEWTLPYGRAVQVPRDKDVILTLDSD